MSDYALVLAFTAADDGQAERIGSAISSLCAAEFSTRSTAVLLDADRIAEFLLSTDRKVLR